MNTNTRHEVDGYRPMTDTLPMCNECGVSSRCGNCRDAATTDPIIIKARVHWLAVELHDLNKRQQRAEFYEDVERLAEVAERRAVVVAELNEIGGGGWS